MNEPIFITKPYLPPLNDFLPYLEEIWESRVLTNGGAFHEKLETALCTYLGIKHISLINNGTTALHIAIQALRLTGEVITTPFSFVATSHALRVNGIKPVFVDIDPSTLNIDPRKVEAAITPRTTAILPVHCYGNPCDMESLEAIAEIYNLKVLYDAAHAFGVHKNGESVLTSGDMSTLSFHATKVFNTLEGGAIISPDAKTKQRVDRLKNFGFVDELTVVTPGINGKMNEVSAALGLLQLSYIDSAIARRGEIDRRYRCLLQNVKGIRCLEFSGDLRCNYSYFPIIIDREYSLSRDALYGRLKEQNIHTRRYFYPLISNFTMYRSVPSASNDNLPVASQIAEQVLCLPIYPELSQENVERIADIVRSGSI